MTSPSGDRVGQRQGSAGDTVTDHAWRCRGRSFERGSRLPPNERRALVVPALASGNEHDRDRQQQSWQDGRTVGVSTAGQ
jgi:hypothetical protein